MGGSRTLPCANNARHLRATSAESVQHFLDDGEGLGSMLGICLNDSSYGGGSQGPSAVAGEAVILSAQPIAAPNKCTTF